MAFIYKITNLINNKIYIGQTVRTLEERFAKHLTVAAKPEFTGHLQLAIRKYGAENFIIEPIVECDKSELNDLEKYYIALYNSTDNSIGYNMTIGGEDGSTLQYLSPEALAERNKKISDALKGRPQPADLVEKRAAKLRGQKRTAEARAKMSAARIGTPAWNKGIAVSEDTKEKLRQANLGKKQSDETKQKRKEAMSKLRWYNNGIVNVRRETCPEGFKEGKIKK